jgi:hypothetical protein
MKDCQCEFDLQIPNRIIVCLSKECGGNVHDGGVVQQDMRNVFPMLETDFWRQRLHTLLARFMARGLMNNAYDPTR